MRSEQIYRPRFHPFPSIKTASNPGKLCARSYEINSDIHICSSHHYGRTNRSSLNAVRLRATTPFALSLSKGRDSASRLRQAQPERLSEQYWVKSCNHTLVLALSRQSLPKLCAPTCRNHQPLRRPRRPDRKHPHRLLLGFALRRHLTHAKQHHHGGRCQLS